MEFHQYFCCSLPYFYTKEVCTFVYVYTSCSILNFYEFKSDSVKRQIGFWYETIACESVVPIIMKHETWSCAKSANWIRTFFANSSICASYYSSHAHCSKMWYFIQPKSWQILIYGNQSAILDMCTNVHFLADFIFGEKWFHEFFWHFLHIWEHL